VDIEEQISGIVEQISNAERKTWLWDEEIDLDNVEFREFEPVEAGRVAAVDGSSGIAEPFAGLYLGVVRAGYVLYSGKREKKEISPLEIFQIGFHNSKEIYAEKYSEIFGEKPPEMSETEPKYMVQRIRTLEEYKYAFKALRDLGEGDILLIDGALRGDRHTPDIAIKMLSEMAQDKGVSVVGISKNSGLLSSGMPLIPMMDYEAEKKGLGRWYARISGRISGGKEEIYVVRYDKLGESAFRTDIISLESAKTVFGKISGYCQDIAYLGYPYPLADVHNEVIIRSGTVEDISLKFWFETVKKGLNVVENFHRKLDRGV